MMDKSQKSDEGFDLKSLGSALSDASRLSIVNSLLDGRSLTALELAHGAGITPQTASFHLNKLTEIGLVSVSPQGRHRYFKLASRKIAEALQVLMTMVPKSIAKPAAKKQNTVCFARTCYGHLAGKVGIALADSIKKKGYITRANDTDYVITESGKYFFHDFGVEVDDLKRSRRRVASQCLDWSERQSHIGGALGFVLTAELKKRNWIKTKKNTRDVSFTNEGMTGLQALLDVDVEQLHKNFFD